MMPIIYALPVVPIVGQAVLQILATVRLRAATEKISGVIRSRSDLDLVRNAIQTNLFLGVAIIGNGVLMAAALFWITFIYSGLMLPYIAALAGSGVVLWKICRPVEKQFKSLPVESEDASLLAEYRYYVEQWNGPHVFLKPPKSGDAQQKEIGSK